MSRIILGVLVLAGLLAPAAGGSEVAAEMGRCEETARDVCLLAGRFRATVTLAHGRAWTIAGGDETKLVAATDGGEVAMSLRVVDGRAVNGYFWLLYNALTDEEMTIEIVDRATGNRRRFVKEQGAPASETVMEALSASAQVVDVTLDSARAVTKAISTAGGSITVLDAQGTRFVVAFPADALNLTTDITVTPVIGIAGLPLSGGLRGAVRIEPEGIIPARTVRLTITPAPAVPPAQQMTFAFRGLQGEFFLTPPLVTAKALVVPVHRFGGYGLGAGTTADLSAQLAQLPSREEDRLSQRLAGLLLPVRRAGKKTVPASVESLLVAEFDARIKPKLAEISKGSVAKYYPKLKNWTLSAHDAGFLAAVEKGPKIITVQRGTLNTAELKGDRLDFNKGTDACIGRKDEKAMVKAFTAHSELYRKKKLTGADLEKLRRCARFELKWDTAIAMLDQPAVNQDKAKTTVLLEFVFGEISGTLRFVEQQLTLLLPAGCNKSLVSNDAVKFIVDRLDVPILNLGDDELVALRPDGATTLYYDVLPELARATWQVACPPGDPGPLFTFWVPVYVVNHIDELSSDGLIRAPLLPGGLGVYGTKTYQISNEFSEDTLFTLIHKPLS